MNCSPTGSSGLNPSWDFPGKNTGVGCHFFSRISSRHRDQIWVSCIVGRHFTIWVTRKAWKTLIKIWRRQKEIKRYIIHMVCCCCSVLRLCPTLWDPIICSTPDFPILHFLTEFAQTHVCWVNNAIRKSYPLLSPSPPAFNLSQHQGLCQWFSSPHQVAKVFAVQGALKSLLQHHSSKALILLQSVFFMVEPSHPYMTIGRTITWTIHTYLGKSNICAF